MSKHNTYHGNYLGIVVQNNDPQKRGRVKVWIPHISVTIYENWASLDSNNNIPDKAFRFPGSNIKGDLTKEVMDTLKKILPWSECALPLVGENASGRYHAHSDTASISDTNRMNTFTPTSGAITSDISLNNDQIGESPGRKYELQKLKLYDAFTGSLSGTVDEPNKANILGYNYTPSTYSNKSKGAFSIPSVGAHIWCFFRDGDPTDPVYFAASHGAEDWKGIYDNHEESGVDYPSTFENKSNTEDSSYDINTDTYRNKFIINQKGGVLEFVNTDQKELLKMTHYSGSFKEFNNQANIELATQNDQKLVLEDQFLTVKGYGNYYIGRDSDNLIKGDHFIKIGKLDQKAHQDWRETARQIANVKQLFETQRTRNVHENEDYNFAADPDNNPPVIHRKTSSLQTQSGTYEPCPVCTTSDFADSYWDLNNTFSSVGVEITNSGGNGPTQFNNTNITSTGANYGKFGTTKKIFNDDCPCCAGTGLSPSSMRGDFTAEPKKAYSGDGQGEFEKLVIEVAGKLKDIEKKMGRGGSQVVNVAKHKVETVGLAMNDFGSIRVDNQGKFYRDSVIVHSQGVINSQKESPLIEYVHVDDLPGGTYTLNVCNKWNVQVGAGGVSMKSFGPVDIGGTIVNMAGEQVNVTSQSEVNIDGGKRLTMVADILTLRQRNRKQVLVDSNLGVSQNVVIGGGMHVEGELSVNHVTAPCEIQETELTRLFGKLLSGLSFSASIGGVQAGSGASGTITLTSNSNDNKVQCYDHSHNFKNLPLHLKKTNEGVREVAKTNNKEIRHQAAHIRNTTASNKVT